jgi:hypothetical protein
MAYQQSEKEDFQENQKNRQLKFVSELPEQLLNLFSTLILIHSLNTFPD